MQIRLARGLTVPAALSSPSVGIGIVLLVALALRAPLLAGGQIDYDEGVYGQSLRSLAAGHQLFASVYSWQPPATSARARPSSPRGWCGTSTSRAALSGAFDPLSGSVRQKVSAGYGEHFVSLSSSSGRLYVPARRNLYAFLLT